VVARLLDALERFSTTWQGDTQRLRGTPDEWRLRVGAWRVRLRYDTATQTLAVLRILLQCGADRGTGRRGLHG